jgi:hypothetical protein
MIAALFDANGTFHTDQFGHELMKYVSMRGDRLELAESLDVLPRVRCSTALTFTSKRRAWIMKN